MDQQSNPMKQLEAEIQPAEAAAKMNFLQRVLGVFISPEKTMKDLAERPNILFPILLYVIVPVVTVLAGWSYIESTLRHSLDIGFAQQNITMTPEQVDSMLHVYKIAIPIVVPIFLLLLWFIGTAVYFGIIKLFRGEGKLRQYLSVAGYSSLITVLGTAVTMGIGALTGATLDLSLAVLLPDPSGSFALGFVKSLLGAFSVFAIWNLWVTVVGFMIVSKLGKGKTYGIVVGVYGIFSLLSALLAGFGTAKM